MNKFLGGIVAVGIIGTAINNVVVLQPNNLLQNNIAKQEQNIIKNVPFSMTVTAPANLTIKSESSTYIVLNWSKYATSWENFVETWSKFDFTDSIFEVSGGKQSDKALLKTQTSEIKINPSSGTEDTNSVFKVKIFDTDTKGFLYVSFNLWHDGENIYWKSFYNLNKFPSETKFNIHLSIVQFISNSNDLK